MSGEFELPGAPNFSRYMRENVGGPLSLEECREEGLEPGRRMYVIRWFNRVAIGVYGVSNPKEGETGSERDYSGKIPGFDGPEGNVVSLIWSNKKHLEGLGKVKGDWKRQDPYRDKIPFP